MDSKKTTATLGSATLCRSITHRKGFVPPRRTTPAAQLSSEEVNQEAKSPVVPRKKRDLSPLFKKIVKVLEKKPALVEYNGTPQGGIAADLTEEEEQDNPSGKARTSSGDSWFEKTWDKYEDIVEAGSPNENDVEMAEPSKTEIVHVKVEPIAGKTRSLFQRPPGLKQFGNVQEPSQPAVMSQLSQQPLSQSQNNSSDKRFFSAVYAKASTRKHKRFEDDGYIVVSGDSSIALKNTSGKTIESSNNYKITSEMLEDGKIFKLGGREIQISDQLPSNPFATDVKPALPEVTDVRKIARLPVPVVSKPFVSPCAPGTVLVSEKANKNLSKPMFDPEAPDALVMPVLDPNEDVLVVVDPHLSRHLREHQREGVTFLYKCVMGKHYNGAILGDEMGLGKTLQCIALLWTLMKQGPYQRKEIVKRALIIAPSSLVSNWEKEFHRWLGHERTRVFGVNSDHPLKHCPPQCPVIIISYEMATRSEEALNKMRFDVIVCDEAHKIKNKNGQAYVFLSKLACKRRVLLTGTPVQNDLMELYALVDFANPGVLGSEQEFRKEYEKPIEKYQESHSSFYEKQFGQAKALQLNNILNNFFLRRTHSVMIRYLPPRVTYVVFCKPSTLQVNLYKRLLSLNVVQDCVTGTGNCSAPLTVILALKKLCNHPNLVHPKSNSADKVEESIYYDLGKGFPEGHRHDLLRIQDSGKMKVLSSLLKSLMGQKVVVVSHYTQTLDLLQDLCKMFDFRFKRLDGSTMAKQRQKIVDDFNNGSNEFIFLLSSKAGGLGLNLQGAANIILYDIDWNPAHDIQAMSRCWRPGQKKITNIYRLVTSGSIEERIFHRQIAKQDLSGSVMDLLLSNSSVKFSPQDLKDIFSFYDEDGCLTHELIECSCPMDGTSKNLNTSFEDFDLNFETEDEDLENTKPLKLQPPKKKLKSISSMAELNSWDHHGKPFENLAQPGLQNAVGDIQFVFCSRSLPSPDEAQS